MQCKRIMVKQIVDPVQRCSHKYECDMVGHGRLVHVAYDPIYCPTCDMLKCNLPGCRCSCPAAYSAMEAFEDLQIRCGNCKAVFGYKEFLKHVTMVRCKQCGMIVRPDHYEQHLARRCPVTVCKDCGNSLLSCKHNHCFKCHKLVCPEKGKGRPLYRTDRVVAAPWLCLDCARKVPACENCGVCIMSKEPPDDRKCITCGKRCCINCFKRCPFTGSHVCCGPCMLKLEKELVANCYNTGTTQIIHMEWLRTSDGGHRSIVLHCPICERCGSCDARTHYNDAFKCSFCGQGNCEACVQECMVCKARMRCKKCAGLGRACCQHGRFGPLTFAYTLAYSTTICRLYLVAKKFKQIALLKQVGSSVSNTVWNNEYVYLVNNKSELVSYCLKDQSFSVPALAKIVPNAWSCSLQLFAGRFIYICTMRDVHLYRYDIVTKILSTLPAPPITDFIPTFKFNEQYLCAQYNTPAKALCIIYALDTLDPEAEWQKLHVGLAVHVPSTGTTIMYQTSNLLISRLCQACVEYVCPYQAHVGMDSVRPISIKELGVSHMYGQYNGVFSGDQLYVYTVAMNVSGINVLRLPSAHRGEDVTADQV